MGRDQGHACRQAGLAGTDGGRQPPVYRSGALAGSKRIAASGTSIGGRQLDQRFRSLSAPGREGVFEGVFKEQSGSFDVEWARVDGTAVRAREGFGWKGGSAAQAIGRSQGGPATNIAALVDLLGYLVRFELVPGQTHDPAGSPPLPDGLEVGALIGDKAFVSDWLIEKLEARGGAAAITSKFNRKAKRSRDMEMYKCRCRTEKFFAKINEFRAIAVIGASSRHFAIVPVSRFLGPSAGSLSKMRLTRRRAAR
ncbi:MAG: transposase [Albidovulum sp.]|nr:transposase [Albidovulum sp.]